MGFFQYVSIIVILSSHYCLSSEAHDDPFFNVDTTPHIFLETEYVNCGSPFYQATFEPQFFNEARYNLHDNEIESIFSGNCQSCGQFHFDQAKRQIIASKPDPHLYQDFVYNPAYPRFHDTSFLFPESYLELIYQTALYIKDHSRPLDILCSIGRSLNWPFKALEEILILTGQERQIRYINFSGHPVFSQDMCKLIQPFSIAKGLTRARLSYYQQYMQDIGFGIQDIERLQGTQSQYVICDLLTDGKGVLSWLCIYKDMLEHQKTGAFSINYFRLLVGKETDYSSSLYQGVLEKQPWGRIPADFLDIKKLVSPDTYAQLKSYYDSPWGVLMNLDDDHLWGLKFPSYRWNPETHAALLKRRPYEHMQKIHAQLTDYVKSRHLQSVK